MSLVGGSVTVADDGSRTGSGLALARYDAILPIRITADLIAALADRVGPPPYTGGAAILLAMKRALAAEMTAMSDADITYLVANTDVNVNVNTTTTIGTGPSFNGLQRTGSSFVADADLNAPTSPKPLSGTGTGTGGPTAGSGGIS